MQVANKQFAGRKCGACEQVTSIQQQAPQVRRYHQRVLRRPTRKEQFGVCAAKNSIYFSPAARITENVMPFKKSENNETFYSGDKYYYYLLLSHDYERRTHENCGKPSPKTIVTFLMAYSHVCLHLISILTPLVLIALPISPASHNKRSPKSSTETVKRELLLPIFCRLRPHFHARNISSTNQRYGSDMERHIFLEAWADPMSFTQFRNRLFYSSSGICFLANPSIATALRVSFATSIIFFLPFGNN